MSNYTIILYYNYTTIENPEVLMNSQRELCEKLGLKGRMIIATEGINGTLEGTNENIEKYIFEFKSDPRFANTHIKTSEGTGSAFRKLSIKVRNEIVSLHLGDQDVDPTVTTGKYLHADELHKWFEDKKEFYIVDMRNDYEFKVGHFENSIFPELKNFRDLSSAIPKLEHLRDKTILTVCTGGVRCEKASGLLVKSGFNDVYQLFGGIHTYMEAYPNEDFKGKLYVFDGRITMAFNVDDPKHEVISNCVKCGAKSDNYVDCGFLNCEGHRHFICCNDCIEKGDDFCSEECKENQRMKLVQIMNNSSESI